VSGLTRRGLLAGGAAAAVAALVGPARAGAATAPSEPATMRSLLVREDAAAAAYARVGATTGHALLKRIARIDRQHAQALRVGLEALTVPPAPPPPQAESGDPLAARLAQALGTPAALDAAITLEQELVAAYVAAARSLVDAGLLQTVATIAGSHAQQLAALRAAAGRPPVDEVTVSGR
jgi:hypothetical protein